MKKITYHLLLAFIINLSMCHFIGFTQEVDFQTDKLEELKTIQGHLKYFNLEIKKNRKKLRKNISKDQKKEIRDKIKNLEQKNKRTYSQFVEILSGIHIKEDQDPTERKKRNLLEEVQDLLTPVVDGLRRISEKPRRIEKMRYDLKNFEDDYSSHIKALEGIDKTLRKKEYKFLQQDLKKIRTKLKAKVNSLVVEVDTIKRSLRRELGEKRSIFDASKEIFSSFFKTKGKNLFFSLISLFVVFWILMFVKRKVFKFSFFRTKLQTFHKSLMAMYMLISITLAVLGGVFCLYILHDWLLVTIAVVMLTGALWSCKNFVPQFVEELRLILNFGSVREGERIDWKGIPWQIKHLRFYSILINKKLDGGEIKVAARELLKLHSRKMTKNEVWFPTDVNDWVLLEGKSLGRVISQTPDQIIIDLKRGGRKFIKTEEFIGLKPENLSSGYTVDLVLGIDYEEQKDILKILETFKEKFSRKIESIEEINKGLKGSSVEFHSCGESSLNFWFHVECKGVLASKFNWVKRQIQTAFVEICNEGNYTIPFNQLTVHMAAKV